ncbi:putative polypeptide N-acetylgalactosaminyltransferase 9 isoform X1 [Zerene cesonia]|uniref:putative polypeptide N-acetylgalactosaminyltransferase 9 isoform X1 n=1 Tax=Zerene cesonia TaxID=33412 RepID=UPI0018E4F118|nr:putative polypeptide N-acetylgalactosaminyltransferase 9 isoform X1 [Zerene cesonia]XP_038209992.1 putative polypeptide N-acetylgalactosaminyltransferase 9 isoform X1 [Zerene cesonia]XP_038209993.1 putative polypeptide N-acetylgalactosaminyltransferase 9 isoform X1 [Zerene cesonia]XP_038209995.1 putative polypeptide N-acetylgalactosaminyltransferase 9 isoform X1 [Zerene cesonia]XP_038209996.1 putative polypeptide N-acetylgalactosaminyltransferase 9 isoform X1 [Zerene cesonia]XP_038209997.1 
MKYSMFFLRRRTLILKAVLILTALWFMVALLTTNGATRNAIGAPPIEYEDAEAKPLKMAKPTATKRKSESYGNNLSDARTRVDWLGRIAGNEGLGVIAAPGSDNAPGELGKPVILPKNMSEEAKTAVSEGWKKNAFNQYVSDLISIRRKLPDPRDEWCKQPGRYLEDLPQTSVVICFHNEAWSVLLRTVHSVIDRSPPHLIKEIVLVDDFSDMPHLMQQLDDYMSALPKVRIVRATRREGLIRARLLGARYVTAPVLTYLDSHCECTEGWLEPLLDRIARNKTTVVCPVIDVIDDNTLEYHYRDSSSVNVGGFDWNLQFNWHPVPARERARHKHTAEPVWSPTMAGGLFAIDKEFFERLGTYDSGFDIWGGENLELSFKTWMCGGTLEIVPCSHVGHIFRKRSPYKWRTGVNVLKKNSVRLAEVWLDDYAKYYYQRVGNDKGDYGDISSRVALRENLGCKSFEWYLKNIYPELFIPGESVAHGEIRNVAFQKTCLDSPTRKSDHHKPVGLYPCHRQGGNQYWMYSKNGEIRRDETCLDYSGHDVVLYPCHGAKGNQLWLYDPNTKLLRHGSSEKCMSINRNKDKIVMETCHESESRQMWNMENFNPERLSPELTAE